jgi:DNA modification methylase
LKEVHLDDNPRFRIAYEDDDSIVIHGDTFYVMDCISVTSPISLILTDPPYKFESSGGGMYKESQSMDKIASLGTDKFDFSKFVPWIVNLQIKTTGWINAYFFCNKSLVLRYLNFFANRYKEESSYDIHTMDRESTQPAHNCHFTSHLEYIVFFRYKSPPFNGSLHSGNPNMSWIYKKSYTVKKSELKTGHPNEKPLALMKKYIMVSSNEGDIVIDPFLGSGTTLVACKQLNRRFIGIEKDSDCIQTILTRINQRELF